MKNISITTTLFFVLSACGSFVPTKDLSDLTAEQRHTVNSVQIYDATILANKKYEIINFIEGNSCQNKTWDPAPTRTEAVDQIKYYASDLGANGITDIRCGGREGTSFQTNCWELISCTAQAIRITK